jgi:hypothetical protein
MWIDARRWTFFSLIVMVFHRSKKGYGKMVAKFLLDPL